MAVPLLIAVRKTKEHKSIAASALSSAALALNYMAIIATQDSSHCNSYLILLPYFPNNIQTYHKSDRILS